ncbi:hypothetical protein BH11MYX2_BH11MYX2_32840 [soil metagenome]
MTARPWIQIPPDDPQATYQIAGLVALEAAVAIAARALVVTYPGVNRVPRPDDPAELRTARDLIDDCARLCFALDAHRHEITRYVHDELDADQSF